MKVFKRPKLIFPGNTARPECKWYEKSWKGKNLNLKLEKQKGAKVEYILVLSTEQQPQVQNNLRGNFGKFCETVKYMPSGEVTQSRPDSSFTKEQSKDVTRLKIWRKRNANN